MECILSALKEDIDTKTIKYRKLHEMDTDVFTSDLQDIEIISQMEDLDQMVDLYETTLNEALNKHAQQYPKYSDKTKKTMVLR